MSAASGVPRFAWLPSAGLLVSLDADKESYLRSGTWVVVETGMDYCPEDALPDDARALAAVSPAAPTAPGADAYELDQFARHLTAELYKRKLTDELSDKRVSRVIAALNAAFGDRDLGVLGRRIVAARAVGAAPAAGGSPVPDEKPCGHTAEEAQHSIRHEQCPSVDALTEAAAVCDCCEKAPAEVTASQGEASVCRDCAVSLTTTALDALTEAAQRLVGAVDVELAKSGRDGHGWPSSPGPLANAMHDLRALLSAPGVTRSAHNSEEE